MILTYWKNKCHFVLKSNYFTDILKVYDDADNKFLLCRKIPGQVVIELWLEGIVLLIMINLNIFSSIDNLRVFN